MGQRFQIIIKTPKEYWNNNNPNNQEGGLYIFHCQGMWGYFSIWRMGQLIKGIKKLIKHEKYIKKKTSSNFPIDYKELIGKTIKWVCYKDLLRQNNIYPYYNENSFKFKNNETWFDLFNSLDNNNGIFFLEIKENGSLNYFFINPEKSEGKILNTPLNYKDYLEDYIDENKPFWNKDKGLKESIKEFKKTKFLGDLPRI